MEKKVSIKVIAKEAGVSKTVVSAVINNKVNEKVFVSEKTKNKVLGVIRHYRYVPKKSARELASQQTNTIGLVVHRLTPYFASMVEELQKQAAVKGLEIMPYITGGDGEKEEEYLNMILDDRVDGVIFAAITEGSEARYRKFSSFPYNLNIVAICPAIEELPSVHFDEEEAGRLVAAHLIEIGCKNLATFGCRKENGRNTGFNAYAEKLGYSVMELSRKNFNGSFIEGQELAREVFKSKNLPDGVFAYNDLAATAFIAEASKRGIRIPDDIAIAGCDNTEVCLYSHPAISSVDTRVSLISKAALEILNNRIKDKSVEASAVKMKIKPELVVRESTNKREKSK